MTGRSLIITLMALAVLLAACGLGGADSASLQDTRWVLVALGGEPPLAGTAPSAEFSADGIRGSAGCNTYFGSYTIRGEEIRISDLAQTEMWCADPEGVMDQEQTFLAALASVTSYRLVAEQLELLDGAGGVLLTFELQPAAP